ncbi:Ribonuclease/ribotoxin [Basidiobolus meristosporus CBS 931.73]|uniref:Ribonuclease/ribotoxin n=1 Tax=Basidiobolus meristosporus CBS 931.73 TaxID=1314790 RepID=A0A1Y1Y259_9FUNG|nr:Ribonuclease/ribotoxin [Basidiobolus meristosporus CBS 931.73]|eukprot:ORX91816.1 Ribonuclease/ribotoxin [Basidiobolus meristosporus CBS 931.73]
MILAARQPVYTVSGVSIKATCGGQQFERSAIRSAARAALRRHANNQPVSNYPHVFRNSERFSKIDRRCRKPYQEFPIMEDSKVYRGGSPGAYRVVIGSIQGRRAKFCGLIYHPSRTGKFDVCDEI